LQSRNVDQGASKSKILRYLCTPIRISLTNWLQITEKNQLDNGHPWDRKPSSQMLLGFASSSPISSLSLERLVLSEMHLRDAAALESPLQRLQRETCLGKLGDWADVLPKLVLHRGWHQLNSQHVRNSNPSHLA
jgi:hypothetical protein